MKKFLFLLGILGAAVFYVSIVLLPMREELSELQVKITVKKTQLAKIHFYLNTHADMAGYEKEMNRRLAVLNAKIPDDLLLGAFIEKAEAAAKGANVVLSEIKPLEEVLRESYAEIPLSITFRGDYWSILLFSKQLAQLDRFQCMKSFSLKAEENSLLCKMECNIFYHGKVKLSEKQEKRVEVSNFN